MKRDGESVSASIFKTFDQKIPWTTSYWVNQNGLYTHSTHFTAIQQFTEVTDSLFFN